jgi:hypothetical protein
MLKSSMFVRTASSNSSCARRGFGAISAISTRRYSVSAVWER